MNFKNFSLILISLFTFFGANAQLFKKLVGDEQYEWREFNVNDFHKINVTQPFNIIYKSMPDSAGFMRIYGEKNILDILSIKSEKGSLSIKLSGTRTPDFGVILIHMYSSTLIEVNNEGAATFEINTKLDEPELKFTVLGTGQIKAENVSCGVLKLNVGGSGDILVSGNTGYGSYSIQGTGEIRAQGMKAEEVNATITGSGNIYCQADKFLKTFLTGNGKVHYLGKPEIKSRSVGTGIVLPLEQ